ncbi:MAG: glycoside hydrolase [Actinomycetota bacterium]|nr:glycoside hydrolase [Actinomycetota bacterium]
MDRSGLRSLAAIAVLAGLVTTSVLGASATGRTLAPKTAYNIGFESFEPTLGAASNGDIYFSTTPSRGVAVGWRASIAKSQDGGRSWKDVGPTLPTGHSNPPETNDPYIYVDPSTDRIFTFHMAPILTCSVMSFSDDGGKTWKSNPKGCSPTVIWDHQTMVAAKPRTTQTVGYPNVLHQCVNAVYAAMCSQSLDGGLTWGPSVPAYENGEAARLCGAQHGHLTASPDGRVYLPTSRCGTKPMVYISDDDGLTWRKSVIANMNTPFVDPTVSVDSKGNLYAAFIDEAGFLYFATSRNNGKKWSKPHRIARGWTANMPVIVAGDPGKVTVTYPGTNDLPKGYKTKGYLDGPESDLVKSVAWGANFTTSTNALAARPRFRTTVATGSDPIGRGSMCENATRCEYLVDFIEAVIAPNGTPYASFVDGCLGKCARTWRGEQKDGTGLGLLATLPGTRLCKSTCWRYKKAPKAAFDPVAAWDFASSPGQISASAAHAEITEEQRSHIEEATRSRLEAAGS